MVAWTGCFALTLVLARDSIAAPWTSAPATTGKPAASTASRNATVFGRQVIDKWQGEQGLPQNTVETLIQTRDGYLWAGTQEGLARFDGVRFTVFDKSNEPAIASNWVLALNEDSEGALWIGTRSGLLRRRQGKFTRFSEEAGLPDRDVSALARDAEGTLWVATTTGLCRMAGERCVPVTREFEFATERVVALTPRRRGGMWLGTTGNVLLVEGGRITSFTDRVRSGPLQNIAVESLLEDASGSIWVGLRNGLVRLKETGEATRWNARELGGDVVRRIFQDRKKDLWFAVDGAGLFRLEGNRIVPFASAAEVAPGDRVSSWLEDREGSIWLGTGSSGLWRIREARLGTVGVREGLPAEVVWAINEDAQGTMWFGGDGGWLASFRDGAVTRLGKAQGIPQGDFSAIVAGDDGLWIAGYGMGVAHYQGGRTQVFSKKDGLPDDDVAGLAIDRDGTLWAGCRAGLARRSGPRFETIAGLPPGPRVRMIHVDGKNVVWAATDRGLVRVENGQATVLTTADGLASDEVTFIHEDASGALWLATVNGLSWLVEGRLRSIYARNGLFNDYIYSVLEDASGNLWMSTNKGIFRVHRSEIERFLRGEIARVTSTTFGIADGMLGLEANGGVQSAALHARDGTLWFATTKGAVAVRPERMQANHEPPPVAIEELVVDGAPMAMDEGVFLPPGKRRLEFSFTALSFVAPSRILFKYRLEGFDEWSEPVPSRTAAYTSVPPGRYRFQVMASNEDGVWNQEGAFVFVTLEPHLWQTRAFMGLMAVGSVSLVLLGHRLRTRRLRARETELMELVHERTRSLNEEKERAQEARREAEEHEKEAERQRTLADQANEAKSAFLANMSHELRTPLNGILGFAQLMDRRAGRDPEDRQHLGTILRSGEHLLGLINEVLSLSKIEAGRVKLLEEGFDLDSLLRDLLAMLRVKAEAKGLWLRHEAAPGTPPVVLGDAGKLRQVVLNLLGNAVKFTESGGVTVRSSWRDGRASFEIEDTGPGIDAAEIESLFQPFVQTESGRKSKEGTGLGLAVSQKIVRLMGGEITVNSAPGRGSIFRLQVSLPAASGAATAAPAPDRRRVKSLAEGQKRFRLLVADDVTDNRILLGSLLASVGFEVEMASSGEEAVAAWRRFKPHFVWMDKRMPGVDGLAATRKIREEEGAHGLPRTKIVALSASAFDHEREGILAAGCDDFVPKPFREATVFEKLGQHLGVAFVYEEATPPSDTSFTSDFPSDAPAPGAVDLAPEWVNRMQEALRLGDLMQAAALIQELDPSPLSEALSGMLKEYRLEEMERLLAAARTTAL
jgi:signal transduction histidine kinase/ligand-binding sensor domain-containing protein/ActR/RegA family two-component response regulator